MPILGDRFKNAWNAFIGRDPTEQYRQNSYYGGYTYSSKPDRPILTNGNLRAIINTVYSQIANDVSMINIDHVRLDDEGNFKQIIKSPLDRVLRWDANLDQTGKAFIRDTVISMLDEGCVAIVPTLTSNNPYKSTSFDIYEARTGKIIEWMPKHIRVKVYNEELGKKEELVVEKRFTPIIENPFYTTMNEPNATAKRLIRVLNQLDRTNESNSAGKLDIVVQLPYSTRSDIRKNEANQRRKEIEDQLTGSQYGIAYTDVNEKIIQLNRSVENNLWTQATDLTAQLFSELGLSPKIFDGTADEQTMINYHNRTLAPILSAITEEIERKWLSTTAITQKQGIRFINDPFKLVPVSQMAEMADKFTRNEILTSNEFRAIIGRKPSDDPKANMLVNSNLNHPGEDSLQDKMNNATDEDNDDETDNE